jgi:predicted heme/steroid binding protein
MNVVISRAWTATLVAFLIVMAVAMAGCGGSDTGSAEQTTPAATGVATSPPGAEETVYSAAELAEFDGKDGAAAYVAVDGVVYDVSGSSSWAQGEHDRCDLDAMAGKDLTTEIDQAPANMRALLQRMPVVGRLEQ